MSGIRVAFSLSEAQAEEALRGRLYDCVILKKETGCLVVFQPADAEVRQMLAAVFREAEVECYFCNYYPAFWSNKSLQEIQDRFEF